MSTGTAELIAANPGPAAHIALLGIVIVIGLVVYAVVRVRHKREAAEAAEADETGENSQKASERTGGDAQQR